MPEEVQLQMLHSVAGLEKAELMRQDMLLNMMSLSLGN